MTHKDDDLFAIESITLPDLSSLEIINKYSETLARKVFNSRLEGILETFTEKMVLKMFRDGLIAVGATIHSEKQLFCEYIFDKLPDLRHHGLVFPEPFNELMNHGKDWIVSYKHKDWSECIEETILISHLDSLFNFNRLPDILRINESELEKMKQYCTTILDWLESEFSASKTIVLRPNQKYDSLLDTECDIIIDDKVLGIITTVIPKYDIPKMKNQLFGYATLASHYNQRPPDTLPNLLKLDKVGFLLPLSLKTLTIPI